MTCRTCKFLDVPPQRGGKIVVRKNCSYLCTAPAPELPALSHSITAHYTFRWPPMRSRMGQSDGIGCPTYSVREKQKPKEEEMAK